VEAIYIMRTSWTKPTGNVLFYF